MKLSQQALQFRILHAALLASLAIYAVIVVMVTRQPGPAPAGGLQPGLLLLIFGGLAAVELLLVVPFLRRTLMPAREPFPEPLDVDEVNDHAVDAAVNKLRVASIATWALCESVAILGLVAGFLFHRAIYFVPFGAVGAAAMLFFAPRRTLLDEVVRAAMKR